MILSSILFIGCGGNKWEGNYYVDNYFVTVCIGDHEYYIRANSYYSYIANKLNDDGTPVKCRRK